MLDPLTSIMSKGFLWKKTRVCKLFLWRVAWQLIPNCFLAMYGRGVIIHSHFCWIKLKHLIRGAKTLFHCARDPHPLCLIIFQSHFHVQPWLAGHMPPTTLPLACLLTHWGSRGLFHHRLVRRHMILPALPNRYSWYMFVKAVSASVWGIAILPRSFAPPFWV